MDGRKTRRICICRDKQDISIACFYAYCFHRHYSLGFFSSLCPFLFLSFSFFLSFLFSYFLVCLSFLSLSSVCSLFRVFPALPIHEYHFEKSKWDYLSLVKLESGVMCLPVSVLIVLIETSVMLSFSPLVVTLLKEMKSI